MTDEEFQQAFGQLRAEDQRRLPGFEVMRRQALQPATAPASLRWLHLGAGALALGLLTLGLWLQPEPDLQKVETVASRIEARLEARLALEALEFPTDQLLTSAFTIPSQPSHP